MTHSSLFAGIGGFDLGFKRAGFKTSWQVEIEPFCQAILKTRFPGAKLYGDIRDCGAHNLAQVDVITAGVPCQDVSVAGKRAGLAGARTGLFYEFARILRELRPAWFVFENVPGLLSSNCGRDLAEVYRVLMVECGYGVQRRCLNSQFFGVAQRRRRLFFVGRFGKPCPPEILFEPESGGGDFAAGSEARENLAASITGGSGRVGSRGCDDGANLAYALSGNGRYDGTVEDFVIASPLTASRGHHGHSSERGDGCDNLVAATLSSANHDKSHAAGRRREDDVNLVATLNSGGNDGGFRTEPGEHLIVSAEIDPDGVRDFAGLPEGLDSARYRALGNAVTVQVAEWIARRILKYEL